MFVCVMCLFSTYVLMNLFSLAETFSRSLIYLLAYFPDAASQIESFDIDEIAPQAQLVVREALMRVQMYKTGFRQTLLEPEVIPPRPKPSPEIEVLDQIEREK